MKKGLKVVKHHGPEGPRDFDTLSGTDIAITTYNTLTAEFQI